MNLNINTTRLILFHKHPVSANMHFLYFPYGSVCAFEPLPKLAAIVDADQQSSDEKPVVHPASVKHWGEEQLGMASISLNIETEFCVKVEVPNNIITIYLAGFAGDNLPKIESDDNQASFVTLMECVGIPPVEMQLLQKAYGVIMGGQS